MHGNKFGFVRYDCQVSAGMAISRMNGVWVDNMKLFVKEACFGQDEVKLNKKLSRFHVAGKQGLNHGDIPNPNPGERKSNEKGSPTVMWRGRKSGKSFAQVVGGESSKAGEVKEQIPFLKVRPIGNGWLERSAVAIMNRVVSLTTLEASFSMESEEVAQFRAMGGRSVLVTFQSREVRDELIKGLWMKRWFIEVKAWRGEPASFERFAWLSYSGIPLNAWNVQTFQRIGELWGNFIKIDNETLKDLSFANGKVLIATEEPNNIDNWIQMEVQGLIYDIHVKEEFTCTSPDDIVESSVNNHQAPNSKEFFQKKAVAKPEKEEDDEVECLGSGSTNGRRGVGVSHRLNSIAKLAI